MTNVGLALFNMLPIPPLDGSHLVTTWLRGVNMTLAATYFRYGSIALLALVVIQQVTRIDILPVGRVTWAIVIWFYGLLGIRWGRGEGGASHLASEPPRWEPLCAIAHLGGSRLPIPKALRVFLRYGQRLFGLISRLTFPLIAEFYSAEGGFDPNGQFHLLPFHGTPWSWAVRRTYSRGLYCSRSAGHRRDSIRACWTEGRRCLSAAGNGERQLAGDAHGSPEAVAASARPSPEKSIVLSLRLGLAAMATGASSLTGPL